MYWRERLSVSRMIRESRSVIPQAGQNCCGIARSLTTRVNCRVGNVLHPRRRLARGQRATSLAVTATAHARLVAREEPIQDLSSALYQQCNNRVDGTTK